MYLIKIDDEVTFYHTITPPLKELILKGHVEWCINLVEEVALVDLKWQKLPWLDIGPKPWYLSQDLTLSATHPGWGEWLDLAPYWKEWDEFRLSEE